MILSFFQVTEEINIFVSLDKEATLTLLVVENIFYYSINEIIFFKSLDGEQKHYVSLKANIVLFTFHKDINVRGKW